MLCIFFLIFIQLYLEFFRPTSYDESQLIPDLLIKTYNLPVILFSSLICDFSFYSPSFSKTSCSSGWSRTGHGPLAFCSECWPPLPSHQEPPPLSQHYAATSATHLYIWVQYEVNSKRTARPRSGLGGSLRPWSHVTEVVRSLRCRALSCLTFRTSPWTTTPRHDLFLLTVGCVRVCWSMYCQIQSVCAVCSP